MIMIMITGISPGIGKTTLAESLAGALRGDGVRVELVPEGALFTSSEFAEIAGGFRRRDFPTADLLLAAFRALVRTLTRDDVVALFDWSYVDLAEDLPWAEHDEARLHEFTAHAYAVASSLHPSCVYLDGGIDQALSRAREQRGKAWIDRYAGASPGQSC